jgi:carbohydrate-selective porin OprB
VVEFDYRIQLNSWSYVQPVVEYIVRPNGITIDVLRTGEPVII